MKSSLEKLYITFRLSNLINGQNDQSITISYYSEKIQEFNFLKPEITAINFKYGFPETIVYATAPEGTDAASKLFYSFYLNNQADGKEPNYFYVEENGNKLAESNNNAISSFYYEIYNTNVAIKRRYRIVQKKTNEKINNLFSVGFHKTFIDKPRFEVELKDDLKYNEDTETFTFKDLFDNSKKLVDMDPEMKFKFTAYFLNAGEVNYVNNLPSIPELLSVNYEKAFDFELDITKDLSFKIPEEIKQGIYDVVLLQAYPNEGFYATHTAYKGLNLRVIEVKLKNGEINTQEIFTENSLIQYSFTLSKKARAIQITFQDYSDYDNLNFSTSSNTKQLVSSNKNILEINELANGEYSFILNITNHLFKNESINIDVIVIEEEVAIQLPSNKLYHSKFYYQDAEKTLKTDFSLNITDKTKSCSIQLSLGSEIQKVSYNYLDKDKKTQKAEINSPKDIIEISLSKDATDLSKSLPSDKIITLTRNGDVQNDGLIFIVAHCYDDKNYYEAPSNNRFKIFNLLKTGTYNVVYEIKDFKDIKDEVLRAQSLAVNWNGNENTKPVIYADIVKKEDIKFPVTKETSTLSFDLKNESLDFVPSLDNTDKKYLIISFSENFEAYLPNLYVYLEFSERIEKIDSLKKGFNTKTDLTYNSYKIFMYDNMDEVVNYPKWNILFNNNTKNSEIRLFIAYEFKGTHTTELNLENKVATEVSFSTTTSLFEIDIDTNSLYFVAEDKITHNNKIFLYFTVKTKTQQVTEKIDISISQTNNQNYLINEVVAPAYNGGIDFNLNLVLFKSQSSVVNIDFSNTKINENEKYFAYLLTEKYTGDGYTLNNVNLYLNKGKTINEKSSLDDIFKNKEKAIVDAKNKKIYNVSNEINDGNKSLVFTIENNQDFNLNYNLYTEFLFKKLQTTTIENYNLGDTVAVLFDAKSMNFNLKIAKNTSDYILTVYHAQGNQKIGLKVNNEVSEEILPEAENRSFVFSDRTKETPKDETITFKLLGEQKDATTNVLLFKVLPKKNINKNYIENYEPQELNALDGIQMTLADSKKKQNLLNLSNKFAVYTKSPFLHNAAFKVVIQPKSNEVWELPTATEIRINESRKGASQSIISDFSYLTNTVPENYNAYLVYALKTKAEKERRVSALFNQVESLIVDPENNDKNISIEIPLQPDTTNSILINHSTKAENKYMITNLLINELSNWQYYWKSTNGEGLYNNVSTTEVVSEDAIPIFNEKINKSLPKRIILTINNFFASEENSNSVFLNITYNPIQYLNSVNIIENSQKAVTSEFVTKVGQQNQDLKLTWKAAVTKKKESSTINLNTQYMIYGYKENSNIKNRIDTPSVYNVLNTRFGYQNYLMKNTQNLTETIERLQLTNGNYRFFVLAHEQNTNIYVIYDASKNNYISSSFALKEITHTSIPLNDNSVYYDLNVKYGKVYNYNIYSLRNFVDITTKVNLINKADKTKTAIVESSNNAEISGTFTVNKPEGSQKDNSDFMVEIFYLNKKEEFFNQKFDLSIVDETENELDLGFNQIYSFENKKMNKQITFKIPSNTKESVFYRINIKSQDVELVSKVEIRAADKTTVLQSLDFPADKKDLSTENINITTKEAAKSKGELDSYIVVYLNEKTIVENNVHDATAKLIRILVNDYTESKGEYQIVNFISTTVEENTETSLVLNTLESEKAFNFMAILGDEYKLNTNKNLEDEESRVDYGLITFGKNINSLKVQFFDENGNTTAQFTSHEGGLYFNRVYPSQKKMNIQVDYKLDSLLENTNGFTLNLAKAPFKTVIKEETKTQFSVNKNQPQILLISNAEELLNKGKLVLYSNHKDINVGITYNILVNPNPSSLDKPDFNNIFEFSSSRISKTILDVNNILLSNPVFITIYTDSESYVSGSLSLMFSNDDYYYVNKANSLSMFNLDSGEKQFFYIETDTDEEAKNFAFYLNNLQGTASLKYKTVSSSAEKEETLAKLFDLSDAHTIENGFEVIKSEKDKDIVVVITAENSSCIGELYTKLFINDTSKRTDEGYINYPQFTSSFVYLEGNTTILKLDESFTEKYKYDFNLLKGNSSVKIFVDDSAEPIKLGDEKNKTTFLKGAKLIKFETEGKKEAYEQVIEVKSARVLDKSDASAVIESPVEKKVVIKDKTQTYQKIILKIDPKDYDENLISIETSINGFIQSPSYLIYEPSEDEKTKGELYIPEDSLNFSRSFSKQKSYTVELDHINSLVYVILIFDYAFDDNIEYQSLRLNASDEEYSYSVSLIQVKDEEVKEKSYTPVNFSISNKKLVKITNTQKDKPYFVLSFFKDKSLPNQCVIKFTNESLKTIEVKLGLQDTSKTLVHANDNTINAFELEYECIKSPNNVVYTIISFVGEEYKNETFPAPTDEKLTTSIDHSSDATKTNIKFSVTPFLKDKTYASVVYYADYVEGEKEEGFTSFDFILLKDKDSKKLGDDFTLSNLDIKRQTDYATTVYALDSNTGVIYTYNTSTFKDDTPLPTPTPSPTPSPTPTTSDTSSSSSGSKDDGGKWWIGLLIVLGVIILLAIILLTVKYIKNQRRQTNEEHARGLINSNENEDNRDSINEA